MVTEHRHPNTRLNPQTTYVFGRWEKPDLPIQTIIIPSESLELNLLSRLFANQVFFRRGQLSSCWEAFYRYLTKLKSKSIQTTTSKLKPRNDKYQSFGVFDLTNIFA